MHTNTQCRTLLSRHNHQKHCSHRSLPLTVPSSGLNCV
uniref:Uncharacterized protein n=1 Tax=Anguilla anguilla TaxID=7936 RepID=A0A0E9P917_ANGAN